MHYDFKHFLRHGGYGEYVLQQKEGRIFGSGPSLKSQLPGRDQLRQDFRHRLEGVAAENARMLLSALTQPDSMPLYSEFDLLSASDAINKALQAWDNRLSDIEVSYKNHPQRIRILRANMEDRTALAFAGLINQLRQEDLGIERYVWVTQGDPKVRSAHAVLNGEVFSWDHPSEEGHPGQAPNCRCRAVPVRQNGSGVVLANFTLPVDGIGALPETSLRGALQRLVAQTPAGAAVLAAMSTAVGLRQLGEMIGDARLHRAADQLGLDVTSIEGLWAAYASVWMSEMVATGFGTDIDKDQAFARIAGQAAALYELMAPGTMQQITRSDNFDTLRQFATAAAQAYASGRLRLTEDGWAQGWTEVFPELTEDERRLAELPSFTAEQQESLILADPVLNDGLPAHTGHAPEGDPAGNMISTPITEEDYARILARSRNEPGIASGAGRPAGADWLQQGIRTGATPVPASVAERLEGRKFGSFDSYRKAFWKEVANDPVLLGQFEPRSRARIRNGLAPISPESGIVGDRDRWELDHVDPLWNNGSLYDADNLQIMTPRAHIDKTRKDMQEYRR